jgi:hypothetical protein
VNRRLRLEGSMAGYARWASVPVRGTWMDRSMTLLRVLSIATYKASPTALRHHSYMMHVAVDRWRQLQFNWVLQLFRCHSLPQRLIPSYVTGNSGHLVSTNGARGWNELCTLDVHLRDLAHTL